MLQLLESGNYADTVFDIDGTKFSVHRNILCQRAPVLAESTEEAGSSEIPLSGVDPDMFKLLLRFIYTDEIQPNANFQAVLELANRFECSRLKLAAEFKIVEEGINADNAAGLLLLADSNTCELLHEETIEYISKNISLVMESDEWKKLEKSPKLMSDLLHCFSQKKPISAIAGMRVVELRQKLDDMGLDVDGNRKMLVDRLEKAEEST